MFLDDLLQLWNLCRVIVTTEHGAMVISCFKPWMYCYFCRMPSAEVTTVLRYFCYHNGIAKFLQVMFKFYSTQSTLLSEVCNLLAFTSVTCYMLCYVRQCWLSVNFFKSV